MISYLRIAPWAASVMITLWTPAAAAAEPLLIGCDRADQKITLSQSAVLDPGCVYTKGIDIVASDVVLDCQGALIQDVAGDGGRGIHVVTPADVPQSGVTVRGCEIVGFTNTIRVSRDGFKELAEGAEYDDAGGDILIEDCHLHHSRGSGVFVNGYVQGVTLSGLTIHDAGSVGVYLEAGSRGNTVAGCDLYANGFKGVGPEGNTWELEHTTFVWQGTGREGIAIDGSRDNLIIGNRVSGNAAGGIFLYKNCGEATHTNPDGHWVRRYPASGNLIVGNLIEDAPQGVWVGSRMAQNQIFMDCSDPPYVTAPFLRIVLDRAEDNAVDANTFIDVGYGVRVEDDGVEVTDNTFQGTGTAAVLLGTRFRTQALDLPVTGTAVTGNESTLEGAGRPYQWVHGEEDTRFSDNTSFGAEAELTQGVPPDPDPFLFVDDFWLEPNARR